MTPKTEITMDQGPSIAGVSPLVPTLATPAPTDVLARLVAPDEQLFPYLDWLRQNDPVARTSKGFRVLTRYADISRAYRGTGTEFRGPTREEWPAYYPNVVNHRCLQLACDTIIIMDPPRHTQLRRLVSRAFTPRRVEALQQHIGTAIGSLLDDLEQPLRAGEVVDLNATFSEQLPKFIFAALFGIPESESPSLQLLIDDVIAGLSATATPAQLARADEAIDDVEAYFTDLLDRKGKRPQEDLLSALVAAHRSDPDSLSAADLRCVIRSLWLPAFDTSATTINHAFLAMLERPELAHWMDDHARALMFAEEAHRHRATVMLAVSARIATKNIQLGDVTIPEGTDVRTLPLAGNLDPAAFTDPHHFDPTRFDPAAAVPDRRHAMPLGFSEGIHYCLGAHLARAQTAMSLWMLKARFPDLTLAGPPTRKNTLIMRFVHRLPVRLRSAEVRRR